MDCITRIDSEAFGDALVSFLLSDAAARGGRGFEVLSVSEGEAVISVYSALRQQDSLRAVVRWCPDGDGGTRVETAYVTPTEAEESGLVAPLMARATVALVGGAALYGAVWGVCRLVLGARPYLWLTSLLAPLALWLAGGVRAVTARSRARRRFEKLLRSFL